MEKVLFWKNIYSLNQEGLLIDPNDVSLVALVGERIFIIPNIPPTEENLQKIESEFEKLEEKLTNEEEIQEFLTRIGFGDVDVQLAEDYPLSQNLLAFDYENQEFFNLKEAEVTKEYVWWNGGGYKTIILDENYEETELVISDVYVNLDEWDGSNFVTGGIGKHQEVCKIFQIDGSKAYDLFLVRKWSQHQGEHQTGLILDFAGLVEYLQLINRNKPEYLKAIKNLNAIKIL